LATINFIDTEEDAIIYLIFGMQARQDLIPGEIIAFMEVLWNLIDLLVVNGTIYVIATEVVQKIAFYGHPSNPFDVK
jgi:hypothetical protein